MTQPREHPLEVEFDDFDPFDGPAQFEDDYPPRFARYRGTLFTGVAVDREDIRETRCEYRDGQPHGSFRTVSATGQRLGEGEYLEGRQVGESQTWWPDGTPNTLTRFDDHGKRVSVRGCDSSGRLRHEWTPDRQRTWYADGGLRSDRHDHVCWAHTRDGRRAFGEGVQTLEQAKVYDHFVFHPEVLADAAFELLDDFEFDRGVWMWIHRRHDEGDPTVVDDLRRILDHPNLSVRATAILVIGNRGIRTLAPELQAMLADSRAPEFRLGEYPGQGGRGHAFSLGKTAGMALSKLGG